MIQTKAFQITGAQTIHCEGCEHRIGNALRRFDGVHDVRASATTQQVEVRFDPEQVGAEQLREKLEQLGYAVEGARK